eukprot:TRINITY_DN6761_c0_g1_i3.p1 TRINITY_DN6761_c0_g1~~TRINITY_DN6761_c0_g1_i3.p1  ORF type:complete len:301 (+),score=30.36 TRINITY_DN6761_c0_g1_i3:3-905(+)
MLKYNHQSRFYGLFVFLVQCLIFRVNEAALNVKYVVDANETKFLEKNESGQVDYQVVITLKGQKVEKRVPLSISLVLDTSGNVGANNELEDMLTSAQYVINNTIPGDYLGLLTFDTEATEELNLQPITTTRAIQIFELLNVITPEGSSNLIEGVRKGIDQQTQRKAQGEESLLPQLQAVILFNGGIPNVGITEVEDFKNVVKQISQESDADVRVFTAGQGLKSSPKQLESLLKYLISKSNQQLCEEQGIVFVPLVRTVYGGWSNQSVRFFRQVASLIAGKTGEDRNLIGGHTIQGLSVYF